MPDLNTILNRYRMIEVPADSNFEGYRLNRLFGLNDLIKENLNSESTICEVGSHAGSSGSLFAYYCKHVYCVDMWDGYEAQYESVFDEVMADFNNVTKIKNSSINASFMFEDNFFDLIYIDAAHDYKNVKDDIQHWQRKVKIGGILAGHDWNYQQSDVKMVVEELFGKADKIYEDSSWIIKLNKTI